ncbi:MAG: enoyl-CoA hydratase/isomerase family protein [Deltaproteobacteria bacterium]|nr:enoyl-CoA hydratase/isomerase family protein [Deltaproteobacteria bacterium]
MSYENLAVASHNGVTRITIDRPKVLNALNRATLASLDRALSDLPEGTRVVVLTGAGEKSFVAGADIAEMAELPAPLAAQYAGEGQRILARLGELAVPVIAQVNGYALGGGLELVLACDFAIASDNARFGLPEVGLGVIPGFGGTIRLARKIGPAAARQLLYTGAQLKAEEALRAGLVNEVVPLAELTGRVDAIAAQIAKNAPLAVASAKRSARHAEETDLGTALAVEAQLFGLCFATTDQGEGMRAFLDKRPAQWTGK